MASTRPTLVPQLPPEIIQSIQRILSLPTLPDDPLDDLSPNFNPVTSLNNVFPDVARLKNILCQLARTRANAQNDIDRLRSELGNSLTNGEADEVEGLDEQDQRSDVRIGAIQEVISDLLLQTSRIREKSSESSHVVHEITKDIQLLDLAKRNLVTSINALRKFGMMGTDSKQTVNGVSQLEDQLSASPRKYSDIAQSLAAVKNLAFTFKSSLRVPRIAIVLKRIQELQGEIRSILEIEFDAFFLQDPSKPVKDTVISDACVVVDVLGEDVRNHLIDRYCAIELKEYRRIFRASDEACCSFLILNWLLTTYWQAGQLDNISRRFAFFRRLLSTYDTDFSRIFPPDWRVGCALCVKWGDVTREDLSSALSKAAPTLNVTLLLDSLQQTTEFEAFIGRKFGIPYADMLNNLAPMFGIRNPKPMSSAFAPHMGVFIDAQDKALSDLLTPHRGAKSRPSLDMKPPPSSGDSDAPPLTVLPSSTELFYFYAQNLEQCAKLSTKSMLFDMFGVWGKWLRIYAEDVLIASMKRPDKDRKSFDGRLNFPEIKHASLLINTADYCQVTALELEEKVKEKISDEFQDKITLQAERDMFVGVISSAILILLREMESVMEGPLSTMQRTSWTSLEHVSGESSYIGELVGAVQEVVATVRDHVEPKKYLRNFYDKAASLILAKFTNTLVKSRPLKETGAEQVLLDLQGLRSCLLKLPGSQLAEGSTYSKSVTKSTTRLETLLKLVIAPVDPAEGFVHNYILLVGDSSFSNFQKVLDLKGTPRAEQNTLLDAFLTITSTKEELENTSFLSSLDMDPGSSSAHSSVNPTGSRVSLPNLLVAGVPSTRGDMGTAATFASLGLSGGMHSPPLGPPDAVAKGDGKKEAFRISDFRRFVNFAVRRDTGS
ncbi:hypothetical protein K439DRAFT_1617197 [Ramaria rubella]|nr:hypothetical protein K439DRAFT_1617197 [Ramaria rubella]